MAIIHGKSLPLAILLTGCLTSGGGEGKRQVALAETALVGRYTLVDYLYEYTSGQTYRPSVLKIEGNLFIQADSVYTERFWIGSNPAPHDYKGRMMEVYAVGETNDRGELKLTLDPTDSTLATSGISTFSFHGDTLVLITSTQNDAKNGFKETDYFKRDATP